MGEKIEKKEKKDKVKTKKMGKKILIVILICILIIAVTTIIYFAYQKNKEKNDIQDIQQYISDENEDENSESNEKIEKIKSLQETNSDIKGWIQIEDTQINYPILQASDNEYYLNHNYKKEKSKYGSIYLKNESNIDDNNSNLILYGHHMKDGEMFANLLKYTDKNYYDSHKEITVITQNEERKYEIIATFKSRIFYQDEENVFRYYNYTNFETEAKFNEYIKNVNKIKLYDTGLTANYGEQLLTMITCEYSVENGRMVVVAKRVQ